MRGINHASTYAASDNISPMFADAQMNPRFAPSGALVANACVSKSKKPKLI